MVVMLDFKVTRRLQPFDKIMYYLIAFLIVVFSQSAVLANDLKAVVPVQNQSVNSALQLTPEEQKWLEKHKTIRIAYDGSLPPYSFVNDAGKIDGIAVEIMAILSTRLGINFTIYPDSNWGRIYKAAAKRKVDMVATMVNRPDRAEWFSFTKPYLTKSLVIVTKQDSTVIAKRDDLNDKKVAVVKGYQYGEQITNEFATAKRVKVDTMLDSLKEVDKGRVDAAILFLGTANYLQAKYQLNNLKIAAFYDRNNANESIAIRKDWPVLVAILQKGLDSLTEQEVQKVFSKWVVGGGIPSDGDIKKPEATPIEPVAKPLPTPAIVEVKQAPANFSIPKTKPKSSPAFLGDGEMIAILLGVLALFFLRLIFARKQKRRRRKVKNKTVTSAKNLGSTLDGTLPLTIEPPDELGVEDNEGFKPETQDLPEYAVNEYIYYQHDCDGRFSYVSPSVTSLLGYSEIDFMANYRSYLTDNPVNRRIDDYIETCVQGQPNEPYEIEVYDSEQDIHWLEVMDTPVYDGQGHCIGVDGVMHDITAQRLYEKQANKLSDQEIPDKIDHPQTLQGQLKQAIQLANQSDTSFLLIYLSLDRLRFLDGNPVNQSEDEVLDEAIKRLHATLRDTDAVVQLSIEQFALILLETEAEAVGLIVEKIRKILQIPYISGVQSIVLDANMGVALYPINGNDPDELISIAQVLSHSGETPAAESKPSPSPIEGILGEEEEDSLQLQQDLVIALDECKLSLRSSNLQNINALQRHSQFSVYYQSRHDLEDYSITGFEALIRWRHPELGLLLPRDFVDLVADIGLLDVMTYWIIQQVSFQAVAWEKKGIRPKLMAINLGDLVVKQAVEVSKIIAIINETGAKPEWLELSIPENEIAKNPDLVIPVIEQLVAAGLVVAIDDFGSDSAVLALIKTIPAQIIEIDPAFIRTLPNNEEDAEIVNFSIAMLHDLGKTVTAKEVETEQQLEFLKASGCDVIQGYLLSRPLPPKEAKALIESLPDFAWYLLQK
jgi:diguanylate cyclase (GGDEF)-like protein/PAS domain S-box-containing protein